ncbi:aminotransferase class V-fold PLP-dependent enzyme [Leptolyngbya sp. 7M]|uniref:aminotransferase class V-fold PLP-dependent enzyme n=1 Tax=Leptolyngbya sp. 7M TaxID=2812896 RepID=UPI001B8B7ED3|nr:aminotransferase class V-fold PLP-dependent enzyme [Leptolyngbya sp. 7M]QYO66136.1 aminotransferase class V-fold PLP-dependent enzyme [Leptolyngbya sp. 7M]
MNAEIRKEFAALDQYTYLNSAAVSPIPKRSKDAVVSQLNDVGRYGSEQYPAWVEMKNRARALLAGMMNVRPEQVAFMRNTSDGIASVACGLDWSATDNIVSFEREFPSNYYAWKMVRDRFGAEIRFCPERDGRIDLEELVSLIDENTKIVALSSVQFDSGFRADLEFVGTAAREVGALFVVDIIQGLGQFGYDLPSQLVDVAAGASHKWLCAPEGCGFVYISDRARELIRPAFVGWISVENPWDFTDREQRFRPNALAWESGTGTSSLFYGLEQSLMLLNNVGLPKIEAHLSKLSEHLCEGLGNLNYEIISSRREGEASAIVCIKHRGNIPSSEIFEKLKAKKIIVSSRGDRLRISPHFYNTITDIDRLLEGLP